METMNIAMPELLKDYVLRRVEQGGYGSASEYIRELIRADQKQAAQDRLELELVKGIQSGEPTEVTAADWKSIRTEVRRRSEARKRSR